MEQVLEVFELEIWSRPGRELDPDFGKFIASRIRRETSIPSEVLVGVSYIADASHSKTLEMALDCRELTEWGFLKFCKQNGLEPSIESPISAAKYLEFQYGREIAWLHLPHTEDGIDYFKKALEWASLNGFNIVNADVVFCISFNNPGAHPIGW